MYVLNLRRESDNTTSASIHSKVTLPDNMAANKTTITKSTTPSSATSTMNVSSSTSIAEATSQTSVAMERTESLQITVAKDKDNTLIERTDKVDVVEENLSVIPVKKPLSILPTSIIVPDDMLVMNVTVKTNVAVEHIHGVTINPIDKPIVPDIETILNITNRGKGQEYEYDYSEPTLPPSLPNVR